MRVVIAGGHGKIALLLERLLAEHGDQAVGLIRTPAHVADVHKAGAEAIVCDLEAAAADDVTALPSGADAMVFAAGAASGQWRPRKDPVVRMGSPLDSPAKTAARPICAPGTWTGPSCARAASPTLLPPAGSGSHPRRYRPASRRSRLGLGRIVCVS